MKNWKLSALLSTPLGLVIVLGSLVLTVAVLIMEVIHDVLVPRIFPEVYWGFIDTTLLIIIVSRRSDRVIPHQTNLWLTKKFEAFVTETAIT